MQTPNIRVSISKRISCVLIFVEETFMKNVSRHPGLDLAHVIIMEKKCGLCAAVNLPVAVLLLMYYCLYMNIEL